MVKCWWAAQIIKDAFIASHIFLEARMINSSNHIIYYYHDSWKSDNPILKIKQKIESDILTESKREKSNTGIAILKHKMIG